MKSPYDIVKRPIITEKSMELIEENKYTFEVDKNANKAEIKHAIETIFEGVKVKKVRTLNFTGKKADWKKAYVTLTEDSEAIEYFDGM